MPEKEICFQCDECGCMDNTASAKGYWMRVSETKTELCTECESGKWHDEFRKIFLPKDMFITNREGNLEHKINGDTDFEKYEIKTK